MRSKQIISIGILGIFMLLEACRNKPTQDILTPIQTLSNNFEDPTTYLRKEGDAAEGKSYTHLEKQEAYSAGVIYPLPDSILNCDVRVVVSCYMRKGARDGNHALVISLQNNDTTTYWETFEADQVSFKNDVWAFMKDSVQIPAYVNAVKGMEIRFFGWSPRQHSYFDIDDLKVEIKKVTIVQEEAGQ